jgi:hypothetical protein
MVGVPEIVTSPSEPSPKYAAKSDADTGEAGVPCTWSPRA